MSETESTASPRPSSSAGGNRKRTPGGAEAAKVVRKYLSALDSSKPGRAVKRTADSVASRILKIDELVVSADPLTRLHLTQERIDLHAEHVRLTSAPETKLDELEGDFVRVARAYGERHGITYAAWRQIGVDVDVLDRAGIHRSRPPARPASAAPSSPAPAAAKPAAPAPAAAKPAAGQPAAARPDASVAPAEKAQAAAPAETDDDSVAGTLPLDEPAPPAEAKPANGTGSHDAEPMRRRRLDDPAGAE